MKRLLFAIILIAISMNINGQEFLYAKKTQWEILKILKPELGDSIRILGAIEMDSVKVDEWNKNDFTDPYGTLTNCTVFVIVPDYEEAPIYPGPYWIGVYKNGEVLWLTDSLYSSPLRPWFYTIKDLNKDGKVDIVLSLIEFTWPDRMSENSYLYVISWDGNTGVFINDGGLHSKVKVYEAYYYDYDLNNDGIIELVTDTYTYNEITDENDSTIVVCCWNGEKYGIFNDCPQWPGPEINPYYPFTKANDFNATLETKIVKNNGKFEYKIKIINLKTSKQNIKSFYFNYPFGFLYYVRPLEEDYGATRLSNYPIIGFIINSDSLQIIPGDSIEYVYRSDKLPKISESYLQSDYEELKFLGTDINQWENYYDNNVLHNSVKKKTLAPTKLPDPFIYIDFLDTLKTYTDNSYSLGWIKDEQTKDKYNNYFSTAKSYLAQGDSSSARAELQKVLTDCNTDSSTVLTSEAYALLYFNTEYLVNKLPEGTTFPPNDIDAKVKAKVKK